MTSKNVTKAETTELAVSDLPDFMKGMAGTGSEGISNEDVGLPRISMLQALSPQVATGEGKPGDFYHLLAEKNLGNKLRFIPIIVSRSYMLWRPRETGGGLLARADDGIHWSPKNAQFQVTLKSGQSVVWETKETVAGSGLDKWGSSNPADPTSLPAATKMHNVLAYLVDYPELGPTVITLQRSSLKPGKRFLGKLKTSQAPSFGLVFEMSSEAIQGPKGLYQSPVFTGKGFNGDAKLFAELKDMYDHFRVAGVKVSDKDLQSEGVDDDAGEKSDTGRDDF